MSKLWRIALPAFSNAGATYAPELSMWEDRALNIAGGVTRFPVAQGAWKAPDGKVYRDVMVGFETACSDEQFGALVSAACELFPDQEAFFTAHIGEATIVDRSGWLAMEAAARIPVVAV